MVEDGGLIESLEMGQSASLTLVCKVLSQACRVLGPTPYPYNNYSFPLKWRVFFKEIEWFEED